MIDQINELPEDGLKSSPKRRALLKINGLVEKMKISCTSYTLFKLKFLKKFLPREGSKILKFKPSKFYTR